MSVDTQVANDAQFFSLRTPLLSEGRSDTTVAAADMLRMRIKVYASGGENVLHRHTNEEHSFVVLQGEATLHIGEDDRTRVIGRYEGVLIPRNVAYWFQSTGSENLVLLRAGAAEEWHDRARLGADGKPLAGHSKENKHAEGVPIPGQFFGA